VTLRTLAIVALIGAVMWIAIIAGISHAEELPPAGPYPDRPCTLANRMDFYHAPDGTLWECVCEALKTGHVCDWFTVGTVKPLATRTHHRRNAHVRLITPVRIVMVAP